MKKVLHFLDRMANSRYSWLIIFSLALMTRFIGVKLGGSGGNRGDDDFMHLDLALSFLKGNGFVMFWQGQGPLYCFQPPGLAVFHIIFITLFKNYLWAERMFFVLMSSATALAFNLLARKFFKPALAFFLTMVFVLYPPQWFWSTRINSHAYSTNMLVICLYLLFLAWDTKRFWLGFGVGLLWGTMSQMRPEYMLGIFCLSLASFWKFRMDKANRFKFPVLLMMGWIVLISPWVIRNYMKVGRFVLSSTHYSYNFWMVFNDQYTYGGHNFLPTPELDARLSAVPEMGKVDIWVSEGIKYIKEDPVRGLKRATLNFLNYWRPWLSFTDVPLFENLVFIVSWLPIFILFLIGVFQIPWRDPQWLAIWSFSLYKMLAQIPFYMIVRFREATFPIFLLIAAIPISKYLMKHSDQSR